MTNRLTILQTYVRTDKAANSNSCINWTESCGSLDYFKSFFVALKWISMWKQLEGEVNLGKLQKNRFLVVRPLRPPRA